MELMTPERKDKKMTVEERAMALAEQMAWEYEDDPAEVFSRIMEHPEDVSVFVTDGIYAENEDGEEYGEMYEMGMSVDLVHLRERVLLDDEVVYEGQLGECELGEFTFDGWFEYAHDKTREAKKWWWFSEC